MTSMTSNSLRMMEKSMDFLWTKQAAHLDNLANAETPGYKVKTVTFEERFRARLQMARAKEAERARTGRASGYPVRAYRQVIEHTGWKVDEDEEITRMDENGVNATEQALESIRTAYQLQYVMQAISSDLGLLRTAIGTS